MGWAPALDLRAFAVVCIEEEPNKIETVVGFIFPISWASAISFRAVLTPTMHGRGGFLAHSLQLNTGDGSVALT